MLALVDGVEACARFLAPDFIQSMLIQVGEGQNEHVGMPVSWRPARLAVQSAVVRSAPFDSRRFAGRAAGRCFPERSPSAARLHDGAAAALAALAASARRSPASRAAIGAARVERAEAALERMTQSEKLSLVHGVLGAPWGGRPKPEGAIGSAGYVPGIPRLGIPALQETDAELGVANPGNIRPGDTATAMPSDLALASTWDLALARRQGEAVGAEARARGFNVLLGGAANLIRDPRGGRIFEYFSEDPLVTGLMAGAAIAGAQSNHIISTIKHFALERPGDGPGRARRPDRSGGGARVGSPGFRDRHRTGSPGRRHVRLQSGQRRLFLRERLAPESGPERRLALSGVRHVRLGRRSFDGPLRSRRPRSGIGRTARHAELLRRASGSRHRAKGEVPQARLDDMARRILTSIFACGLADDASASDPADLRARRRRPRSRSSGKARSCCATRACCRCRRIRGASSSSARMPTAASPPEAARRRSSRRGGDRAQTARGEKPGDDVRSLFAARGDPPAVSARARRLRRRLAIRREAAKAAAGADAVVVFADQYLTEGRRRAEFEPARRAGRADRKRGASQSAHGGRARDGRAGPHAVARPDGRRHRGLVSRPEGRRSDRRNSFRRRQPVRPAAGHLSRRAKRSCRIRRIQGDPTWRSERAGRAGRPLRPDLHRRLQEGAAVGYKWFFVRGERPLFPFGYGLSYTTFGLSDLKVSVDGDRVTASVTVRNLGSRPAPRSRNSISPDRRATGFRCGSRAGAGSILRPARSARRRSRSIRASSRLSTRPRGAGGSRQALSADRRLRRRSPRSGGEFLARLGGAAAVIGYQAANVRLTRLRNAARRGAVEKSMP